MIREFFRQANGKLAARPQDDTRKEVSDTQDIAEGEEWQGLGINKSVWKKFSKRRAQRRHRIRKAVQERVEFKAIGEEIEQKWRSKNQFVGLQKRANAIKETILRGSQDASDTDQDDKSLDQDSSTMSLGVSRNFSVSRKQGFDELPRGSEQLGSRDALRSEGRDVTWKQVPSVLPELGSLPGCCRTKVRGRISFEEDCIQHHVLDGHVRSPGVRGDNTLKFVGKSCLLDEEARESNSNGGGCVRGNND